jgi:gamma-glutamyltranspeptidase/glutathione hydrolase
VESSRCWVAPLLAACLCAYAQDRPSQPEPASGWTAKKVATAQRYMVAAANPLAVEAGLAMLERGGNAIDALVATQLVLNLVEPSSSGLGGGAFLLFYDAKSRRVRAYDGRETAPAGATPSLFETAHGKPMDFRAARIGGRSVGTPGTPRLLEVAHRQHGRLPWKALFEPAIRLAEEGFDASPRLVAMVHSEKALARDAAAREYFLDEAGRARAVGTRLRNPQFAATLRAIAAAGADAFYEGDIARDIVGAVRRHSNPGTLSLQDLAGYRVREVDAVCGPYRRWRLCGMPPSSSGGIAMLQIMGVLSRFDMAGMRPVSAGSVHLVTEAERLAFADRNRYVADDRFVDVPARGLLDPAYIAARSKQVDVSRSMGRASAGEPAGAKVAYADDPMDEVAGTTHISIVDADGNALAMTTTIESAFGSGIMVRGFMLNNELTDFSFLPVEDGLPVANAVAPGKRPRSSMSPTLVFDDSSGAFEMTVGSPGGSFIIGYVAKVLVATLDWNMDIQSAIDLPNFDSRNGPTEIEQGTELERLATTLRSMGHEVRAMDMTSGLQGIRRAAQGWEGGADPRREGVARGR